MFVVFLHRKIIGIKLLNVFLYSIHQCGKTLSCFRIQWFSGPLSYRRASCLREGRFFPRFGRVIQQIAGTGTFKMTRQWETSQFTKGWIYIYKFHKSVGRFPISFLLGGCNNQGNSGAGLKISSFTPKTMFPQIPTMISPQYDYRILS